LATMIRRDPNYYNMTPINFLVRSWIKI
jgi:hypothetical protein